MQPEKLAAAVDENTIGVAAVLGTTYTGAFEDVATLDKLLGGTLRTTPIKSRDSDARAHLWRLLYEYLGACAVLSPCSVSHMMLACVRHAANPCTVG